MVARDPDQQSGASVPEIDPDNLQYQCYFCGEGVPKASEGGDPLDPCAVVLIGRWERPESERASSSSSVMSLASNAYLDTPRSRERYYRGPTSDATSTI